jgi:small subunit ribosomal protein S2
MAPFVFSKRGKIHIIDIKKTLAGMLIAKKLLTEIVSSGQDVIFVGTKRQAQKAVESAAKECGMHYVSHRWLGGTLTNFRTIRSRLQRLEQLETMQENGDLESGSKKQASRLKREMRKIKNNLEGIRNMSRLPGAVVAVDAKNEYIALHEARKLGIATVALLDTDSDPDIVDVAIPANDDSIRAIDLILKELANAVSVGKTMVTSQPEIKQRPTRTRARRTLVRADESKSGDIGIQTDADAGSAQTDRPAEPEKIANTETSESAKQTRPAEQNDSKDPDDSK